jgi:putative endonuclease
MDRTRKHRGKLAYLSGEAAEGSVARAYESGGYSVVERRWRGVGGEIDLILRRGAEFVVVEVKQARDFALAAHRLSARQAQRIMAAAAEFLGTQPMGQLTPLRIDLALVDAQGRVQLLENAVGDW